MFWSENACLKCLNLIIIRFDGSVSENLKGTFAKE